LISGDLVNLPLISAAPLAMKTHLFTVIPAFFLGTWMMFVSHKGSTAHRTIGKIYLLLVSITAVAATFIREPSSMGIDLGPLRVGPIHIFVPIAVWGVYGALSSLKRRDIPGHQSAMRGLYFGGMLVAGTLSFIPGRTMWRVFFG
jgi:uncharacterized membrane protein